MSRAKSFNITAMLMYCDDIPGTYCIWCPELDIVTQGENPENAVGMMIDALRMVCEEDLTGWQGIDGIDYETTIVPNGGAPRKRKVVRHPLRRNTNSNASKDEFYPEFVEFNTKIGKWRNNGNIPLSQLTPQFGTAFVPGWVEICSRGGHVFCSIDFSEHAIVPARTFDFVAVKTSEATRSIRVPSARIADDSPLIRAGLSIESIVKMEYESLSDQSEEFTIVSVRERTPA